MRVEKELEQLEDEIKALKTSFEQSATTLANFAYSSSFITTERKFTVSSTSAIDMAKWQSLFVYLEEGGSFPSGPWICDEVVEVIFRTLDGSNVLADLEINTVDPLLHTIRTNYSGGARWLVDCRPNVKRVSDMYQWSPTSLEITVRSMKPGTMEIRQL